METKHCVQRYLTGSILIVLLLGSNSASVALELSIIESGPDTNPQIGLWAQGLTNGFFGVNRLVSPSGDEFTPESVLEGDHYRSLLLRFSSLPDAMEYVAGTWQATPAPRFPFPSPFPPEEPFDFNVDAIPLQTINRTAPTLLSPAPGAGIKNGTTFDFGWDYLTSDFAPNRTSITRISQFDPPPSFGWSIVSTPVPGSTTRLSGGSSSGDRSFSHTLINVPGADKNRFLQTFTASEAALPLDVQLTLGSYYSNDLGFPSTGVRFFYSRENDPFVITLFKVPEPSSLGIGIVLAIIGLHPRVTRARNSPQRLRRYTP